MSIKRQIDTTPSDEPSFSWDPRQTPKTAGLFDARPPGLSTNARPIYDADLNCIIGYQEELSGISRLYSIDGTVTLSEKPLESPLIDPFDLLLIVGSFWRVGLRSFTSSGIRGVGVSITQSTLFGLRSRYHALMQRELRFAARPLMHMQNPDRYVPVHILRLAIRYGKRAPDPRAGEGLYMYTYPILRNGRSYMLEILVREKDQTILHFVYESIKR